MKVVRLCAVLLCLMAAGDTQQKTTPDTLDRNTFTFLNWNLNLRIEPASESLSARGKVTLRNDSERPQKRASLQISSSLHWASVRLNGAVLPFVTEQVRSDLDHSGKVQEAVVNLPAAVVPGAAIDLEVGYSGTVSLDTTRLAQIGVPLEVRTATDYDRITPTFTCLRGVGHVLWFPVSLAPALLSDGNKVFEETSAWAVRHSTSAMNLAIGTTNNPASREWNGNAQQVLYESMGGVSNTDLVWKHLGLAGPVLIGGKLEELAATSSPQLPFNISFFPQHENEAQDYARIIRDTPSMVVGRGKIPATLIELPEEQDSTFEADTMLLTALKPIDRKSLEVTLAYQLAHQSLWSPRAWIYAGAAHFAQALMRERQDGRGAAISYMQQRLAPLTLEDSGASDVLKSNSLVNTTSEVFYRTKAMYVWWMLREIVGQRAVLDALQQYDPDADKEPSYMQKLLEKNSHKDLEWFFDDWVYQDRGLPEFTISNGYARPSLQGIFLVSATIENQGGAAAEVPIIVHTQNGDVPSRIRVPAHGKTALRVEVSSRPLDVTVNDGSVPEVDRTDNTTSVRIGAQ
ncbi:MAG TPA: hypothetical protein VFU50_06240 [Terriglobales bacterium]|nr:hypothetical protein [Terriglobales bacterium]